MSEQARARKLRRDMSVAEQVFWKICRHHKLGFEIRRQYPIGGYVLDFFCKEAMLAIEFDGEQHDPAKDQVRDSNLADMGIETLRIPNRDFFMIDHIDQPRTDWIEVIILALERRSGRQVPR